MKARVKDWGTKLVGRRVLLNPDLNVPLGVGTLCGYVADGEMIARVLVAYSPGHRREHAVEDVEMVNGRG